MVCAPTTANTNILEPAVLAMICKRNQQDRAQHLKIILVTEHKGKGRENKLKLSFVRHLLERSEGNKRYDSRRREINRNAQRYCAYAYPCVTINNTSSHDYQGQHAELQTINANFTKFQKIKELRIRRPTVPIICIPYNFTTGHAVGQLVEALRYKPEGREFDSRWCHWNFSLT